MNFSLNPEEHELRKARKLVKESLNASKTLKERQSNLRVSLGWIDDEFTVKNLKGVLGHTYSAEKIEIRFNTNAKDWEDGILIFTAHEYAHSTFFEENNVKSTDLEFNWQHILIEAHSQHFTERVYPEKNAPWRREVSNEEMKELWKELKPMMSEEISENPIIDSEEFPKFFGYSFAYRIGEKLLEKHDLVDFPNFKRSEIVEAGVKIFE